MNRSTRWTILFLLLIITLSFAWNTMLSPVHRSVRTATTAKEGMIDLRRWNFRQNGPIPLRGDWIFLHSILLTPEEYSRFSNTLGGKQHYISVPGFWHQQQPEYPIESFGTYILRIRLPAEMHHFGLYMEEISSAYTLYINEKPVIETGTVGTSRKTSRAENIPMIWTEPTDNSEITLIMQVSNFQAAKGGIWAPPLIGTPSQIYRRHYGEAAIDLFLFGSILMIALYHMGIFYFRRKDIESLYFAFFCLTVSLRGILTGSRFFQWMLPWAGYGTSTSLEFICAYLASYFYYRYHILKFPEESWKPFLPFTNVLIGFMILSALIMPVYQHAQFFIIFEVYLICEIFLIMGGVVLAVIRHRFEAVIYMIGFAILFLTVVHDLLYYNLLAGQGYLMQYGLWIFVLLHSLLLARHFVSMEQKALNYAASLEALNSNLADIMRKRL